MPTSTLTRFAVVLSFAAGACAVAPSPAPSSSPEGDPTQPLGWPARDSIEEREPAVEPEIGVAWAFHPPGTDCATNADCDSAEGAGDGFCYVGDMGPMTFPATGYCTIDDGTGTVCDVDTDCPTGSVCADSFGYKLCLPACGPGGACPDDQACITSFSGNLLDQEVCAPGTTSAVDGDGCAGFYDCNEYSACWNDAENPGGQCSSYACTVGTNEGCHGGVCVDYDGPSAGTVCMDGCTTNADCREGEGYVCQDPDGAGGTPAYCRAPHIGDPCATASDCGGEAWTCLTDGYPGGYCTLVDECPTIGNTTGCSSGAICADVGGVNTCLDRCPDVGNAATCRAGYTCAEAGSQVDGGCLPE